MPHVPLPALTPQQWESGDYRQPARDLDSWAKTQPAARDDDATEYVAKLGLDHAGSVLAMNRAHDRVLVPPPARAPLAAFALAGQPFGFTAADVAAVETAAGRTDDPGTRHALRDLGQRIQSLLPPAGVTKESLS